MKSNRIWLIPPLAALFWGSCDKYRGDVVLSQVELDVRFALCGFAAACIALIAGATFWEKLGQ